MSVAALPQGISASRSRYRVWLLGGLLAIVLAGLLYYAFATPSAAAPGATQAQVYEAAPMDLEIKVVKDGEIHAINNIDINCEVEGVNTIMTIIKEGTTVKKGDTLLTLDSTQIRQRIEDTSLELQRSEADVANAREMMEIQKSSNDTNTESAEVTLELAKLALKQYEEGTYPQQLDSSTIELKMANTTLENRLEDLEQTKKLYSKNFVTAADVKKADLDVTTARNALAKAQWSLKVLTEYSHEADVTAKKSDVLRAEQRLQRTHRENNSNLAWRQAELTAKEQNLKVLKRRHDRLKEQYAACTVTAPADGMVVYGSSADRNAQSPIQEGAQVRERQLLMRLPDTSAMQAVVRIHESAVSRLKEGQAATVKIVGQPAPLPAKIRKISVLADNSQRWWNPDLREYPVEIALDATPAKIKPGIGATVEILTDRLPGVLAVPVDAVYTLGTDRYAFIKEGDSVRPARVIVGQNNDTHVQIIDGVKVGQQVLRLQAGQGRDLLEKAGIKVAPATKPGHAK